MFRSSWFYLLALGLGLLTLGLVVRSGLLLFDHPGDEPINEAMRAALARERPELSTSDALLIARLYPTATETPSGLRFLVTSRGADGPKPKVGQEVVVHYAGSFLGGREIGPAIRAVFRAGAGGEIKGLEQAVLDMTKGERRLLIIPWWLAYGAQGRPPSIPPRATLVVDVELLDLR